MGDGRHWHWSDMGLQTARYRNGIHTYSDCLSRPGLLFLPQKPVSRAARASNWPEMVQGLGICLDFFFKKTMEGLDFS